MTDTLSTRVARVMSTTVDLPHRTTPSPMIDYANDPAALPAMLTWLVEEGKQYGFSAGFYLELRGTLIAKSCKVSYGLGVYVTQSYGKDWNEAVCLAIVQFGEWRENNDD